MLQSALNKKFVTALAGNYMLLDDDFYEWLKIVNKVAQRLEMVNTRFGEWQNNSHVVKFRVMTLLIVFYKIMLLSAKKQHRSAVGKLEILMTQETLL